MDNSRGEGSREGFGLGIGELERKRGTERGRPTGRERRRG